MPRTNPYAVTAQFGAVLALSDAPQMMEPALTEQNGADPEMLGLALIEPNVADPETMGPTFIQQKVADPETMGPALTEQNLADPDEGIDAAMDYRIPRDASTDMLRQARRRLHTYIAWLLDEALPGHRSWANDEVQRAVRRLVELEMAERAIRPKLH